MRRAMGMIVAIWLCVSLLTPIAGAMLVTPHACCMRNMRHEAPAAGSMPHSHCGHGAQSTPPSSPLSLGSLAQEPCHRCCSCLGPVISVRSKARPAASFFAPAVESHPFLNEFYPAEDSSGEFRQHPDRAPPSSNSIQ